MDLVLFFFSTFSILAFGFLIWLLIYLAGSDWMSSLLVKVKVPDIFEKSGLLFIFKTSGR